MKIIEVKDLSLSYEGQQILKNVSFSVGEGRIIGLLGPNGAGKSSILKILAGLVFPEKGTLSIHGKQQNSFSNLRSYCGYLIDAPSFYPYMTAVQNMSLIKKINNSDENISKVLTTVGLEGTGAKKVKHFSMGMKQRLAIAQALLRSPKMLILDEPFNGLDPNGFQDVMDLLKGLNKKGITIIISSHLLNELELLADYFILLHQGKIELDITKEALLNSKNRIAFTLDKKPKEALIEFMNPYKIDAMSNDRIVVHLNENEVVSIVKKMVELDCIPVKVEALTVLQEKYLEITA